MTFAIRQSVQQKLLRAVLVSTLAALVVATAAMVGYDLVLYHRGEFFSRAGLDEGMLTWHPFGLHHGPQPAARARDAAAAAAATGERRMADEVAVMIDARHGLLPGEAAKDLDVEGYIRSWSPDA